jgi:hypothetical protein
MQELWDSIKRPNSCIKGHRRRRRGAIKISRKNIQNVKGQTSQILKKRCPFRYRGPL